MTIYVFDNATTKVSCNCVKNIWRRFVIVEVVIVVVVLVIVVVVGGGDVIIVVSLANKYEMYIAIFSYLISSSIFFVLNLHDWCAS